MNAFCPAEMRTMSNHLSALRPYLYLGAMSLFLLLWGCSSAGGTNSVVSHGDNPNTPNDVATDLKRKLERGCPIPAALVNTQSAVEFAVSDSVNNKLEAGAQSNPRELATMSSLSLLSSYDSHFRCIASILSADASFEANLRVAESLAASIEDKFLAATLLDGTKTEQLSALSIAFSEIRALDVPPALKREFSAASQDAANLFPTNFVGTTEAEFRQFTLRVEVLNKGKAGACAGKTANLAQPVNGMTLEAIKKRNGSYTRLLDGVITPEIYLSERLNHSRDVFREYIAEGIPAAGVAIVCESGASGVRE